MVPAKKKKKKKNGERPERMVATQEGVGVRRMFVF